jgi:dTDP-4-dehydrorhamnose reductase
VLSENYSQHEWVFADRTQVSLDNLAVLKVQLEKIQPSIILNCGAYTAVDAESEAELADLVNHRCCYNRRICKSMVKVDTHFNRLCF